MEIRNAIEEDLEQLMNLYKDFFPVHVIFTKRDDEIMDYLKENLKKIFIALDESKSVVGGLLLERKSYGDHAVASFKHIATKDEDKEIIKELVKKVEFESFAGKIELHIAEGEKVSYNFFVDELEYELEGQLKSHYRPNESCYLLGKVRK